MAAADTALSGEPRRAVISSKRCLQWQHNLRTGAACKSNDGVKSNAVSMYRRRSGDVGERAPIREIKENQGDGDDCGIKARARNEQLQKQEQRLDGQRIPTANRQVKRGIPPSQATECLQQTQKDRQQEKEQELVASQPVKRRQRRCGLVANEGLQPSRSRGFEKDVATELPNTRGSKRSSRLLAKKLAVKKPAPAPPLRLPKLQVVLSRKEIHDDWLKITGYRYVGKPKKSALTQLGLGLCASLTSPSSIRYLNDPESKP